MVTPHAAPSSARDTTGTLRTHDGLTLRWRRWDAANGSKPPILFAHGFLDHFGRYEHVFSQLVSAGFSVYAYDMRGHGTSEGRRGHVESYADFLSDFGAMLDLVTREKGRAPFVLAHSNGALITTLYALGQPKSLAGMVLSSPYFKNAIKPNLLELFLAHVVGRIAPTLGVKPPLPPSLLTHDADWLARIEKDGLRGNSLTPRWYRGLLASQEEVMTRASELTIPFLILQAGEDRVANPQASRAFSERATSADKRYVEYPNLFHEIFMEREAGRQEAIRAAIQWFSERVR